MQGKALALQLSAYAPGVATLKDRPTVALNFLYVKPGFRQFLMVDKNV